MGLALPRPIREQGDESQEQPGLRSPEPAHELTAARIAAGATQEIHARMLDGIVGRWQLIGNALEARSDGQRRTASDNDRCDGKSEADGHRRAWQPNANYAAETS